MLAQHRSAFFLIFFGATLFEACSKESQMVNLRNRQENVDFNEDAVGLPGQRDEEQEPLREAPKSTYAPILSARAEGANQVALEWTSAPEAANTDPATAYRLFRDDVMLVTLEAGNNTYEDSNLGEMKSYSYEISALYAGGHESSRSAPVKVSTFSQSGSDLYEAYCSECHGNINSSSKKGSTKERITVAISSVAAMQGLADLSSADIVAIVQALSSSPKDTTKPAAPSGLNASFIGPMGVVLNWTPATDNPGGSGIDRYQLYRNGNFLRDLAADVNSLSESGLTPATAYVYELSVIDNAGNVSAKSAPFNVRTLAAMATADKTPPTTPSQLTATATSANSVKITWQAASDETGGSGLSAYRIYRDGGLLKSVGGSTIEINDSGLMSGTTYSYTVQAEDFAGNRSSLSSPVTVSTLTLNGSQLYAVHCQGCHNLPADARAANKTAAQIQAAIDTRPVMQSLKALAPDVVAAIAMYLSPAPDQMPPTVPANLSASAISAFGLTLNWSAATDAGGSGLAGYTVFRGESKIADVTGISYREESLTPATAYVYKVRARDAAGNVSGFSTTITVNTLAGSQDTTPPSTPAGLLAIPSGLSVRLSWQAATDAGTSGMAAYIIYRGDVKLKEVPSSSLNYTDGDVRATTTYAYRVSARDAAGNESSRSTAVSATTPTSNGEELYTNNCARCHNPLIESTKKNRSATTIRNAIASLDAMKFLSFLTAEQIEMIAVALKPAQPDPQNMVDHFRYNVPLGTRSYVATKLTRLFNGPPVPEVVAIIQKNTTSQVPLFGGPCNIWDGICPGGNLQIALNSMANMSPQASTPRSGYLVRACEELVAQDAAVRNLLAKLRFNEATILQANEASLRATYGAFFPGQVPNAATLSSMNSLFEGAKSISNLPLDGWRMVFYSLCEAPGFDAL